jgi:hypothetical protein
MSNNYYGGGGNSSNGQNGQGDGSFYDQSGGYAQPGQQQQQQQQQQQPGYSAGGYAAPNNQQQWQPQQQQQPQQPGQRQPYAGQQQFGASQVQPQPAFWNPATAATVAAAAGSMASGGLSNDAMFDLASNAGKSFLKNGSARMIPGLESSMLVLRSYFAVDNRYVMRKMQKILMPFLSKHWKRQVRS